MKDGVGVKRKDAGEVTREVEGVTGSRSVTTRMVKRGGMEMEMEGGEQGEVEDGVGTGWEAGMREGSDGGGVE